jgi:hypothetical protein
MMAKGPDFLESREGFQQRDVDPDEGCDFIISDGHVHFGSCPKELQKWEQKRHRRSFSDGTLLGQSDNLLGYLEL